ncbi:MAG: endo-1,4-beta-xylanase [Planctomycetes bacterium]|nr:endo-1,4-beta-xylanase [Planctomycetota bacterium]
MYSVCALGVVLVAALSLGLNAAEEDQAAAIRQHRMGTLVIQTAPNAAVKVTQLRHEFWFGTAINRRMFQNLDDPSPDAKKYLEILKSHFNAAVHENEMKWYTTERNAPGEPDYSMADCMLAWCEKNGLVMRGHAIFWGIEQYVQKWQKALDDAALRKAVERRAREVTAHYKGRIGEFDLNNEMMHGDWYAKRLGPGIVADMFRWAKEGNPDARLYINDYGILQSGGEAYAKHIQGFLDRGIPVGGIGIQGHSGGHIDPAKVKATLDRLAAFKLPIKITEFDMDTADEGAKARGHEALYRTCFAHPAVDGILIWGFWEGCHWRPKAAIWKKDWTPTPAAEVHRRLIYDEWWTRFEGKADAAGRCELPAFFGRHRVEAGGKAVEVELLKKDGAQTVRLPAP